MPRLKVIRALVATLLLAVGWHQTLAQAPESLKHLGSLVVDAGTGQVLYAWNANRLSRPASLTKMMTAYLVLEAIEDGRVPADASWPVSGRAAAQPPTKLYLSAGGRVSVQTLLAALFVVSGNDAAAVLAEGLMGSEVAFVRRMNETAAALGMSRTRFANASGLPDTAQFTTPRDMALLAREMWTRFSRHASLYGARSMAFGGKVLPTVNGFLSNYPGADGLKTGFTCRAGYNLAASAQRDGRRLIGVLLGARNGEDRAVLMRRLLDNAFESVAAVESVVVPEEAGGRAYSEPQTPTALGLAATTSVRDYGIERLLTAQGQGITFPLNDTIVADSCAGSVGAPTGWSIDLGARPRRSQARRIARDFIQRYAEQLPGAREATLPRWTGIELHRVLVTGLSRKSATAVCMSFRRAGGDCVLITPKVLRAQLADVRRIRRLQRRARQRAK